MPYSSMGDKIISSMDSLEIKVVYLRIDTKTADLKVVTGSQPDHICGDWEIA